MGGEKFAKWNQVTVEELQAYMGFMILMGIVRLPSIYDYWQKEDIYHYSPVASKISQDRFFEFHRYLHFVDNSSLSPPGSPDYDKLGKIRPIIEKVSEVFRSVYSPHKELSVDEAMIPFKGRSSLKQYMPKKPVKRGIKVWAVADGTNGYICDFEVYTGKQGDSVEKGLRARVVIGLTQLYKNTFRHVYFDNFFTSFILLIDLFKMGLYACGTIRSNQKGFPKELKPVLKKGLGDRGESKTRQFHNLTTSVWQDR